MKGAGLSERHACRALGFPRSVYRHQIITGQDLVLRARLIELAAQRRRFGYRRLHALLSREMIVNHKRVYRIYTEEGLKLRRKTRRNRAPMPRRPLRVPSERNVRWSMDFMSDALKDGRSFRVLNVIDDFSREALAMEVDTSLPGLRVVRTLDGILAMRGKPRQIVTDNGPEFVSRVLQRWAQKNNVEIHFIDKGKSTQNAFVESFNGRVRDECLNQHWFESLWEARRVTENWRLDYNRNRPHSSLGNLTPEEFALRAGVA